jgi:hypothetical protein
MPLNDWLEILPTKFQQDDFVLSGTEAFRLRHDILGSVQWMEDAVARLDGAVMTASKIAEQRDRAIALAELYSAATKEAQAIARAAIERLEEINKASAALIQT